MRTSILLVATVLSGSAVRAEEPAPSVKVSGYVDTFYQLNFNSPSNLITAFRGFDDRSNSFTIENAVIDVTGTLGRASTRVALQVGQAPASYYLAEPLSPAQGGAGTSGPQLWQIIQQVIVGYSIPVGDGLLAEAGIFLSPIGVEALAVKDNWNLSRSNLFFALPFYHSGVRLTYPLSDRWTGVFYVTNGWNDVVNRNPYPCVSGVVTYAIPDELTFNLVYFGGVEPATGAPQGQPWRNLFDVNTTWTASRYLAFATQADAGFEHNAFGVSSWAAGAAYVRVHPAGPFYLAARGDYFHEAVASNSSGSAGHLFFPADNVVSETITAELRPTDHLSLRLEYRHDSASLPVFYQGTVQVVDGTAIATATRQNTLTFGASSWF
jgi:hypothetical protein